MTDPAPKLTVHQRRILVGLCWLADEHPLIPLDGGFSRKLIAMRGRLRGGVQIISMLTLSQAGLVESDDASLVTAVVCHRCTCGCDRWRPTQAGRALAQHWNVHDHTQLTRNQRSYIGHRAVKEAMDETLS